MKKEGFLKKIKKHWLLTIIAILLIIIILFGLLNFTMKREFSLSDSQKQKLSQFYLLEDIEEIKLYHNGLFSIGSTRTLCSSVIYFNEDPEFVNNAESEEAILLLVHEIFHAFQFEKSCIAGIYSSLSNQLISFFKTGSRKGAYEYSIKEDPLFMNAEQQATLVEDFYCLNFINQCDLFCTDCNNLSTEELIENFTTKVKTLFLEYNIQETNKIS